MTKKRGPETDIDGISGVIKQLAQNSRKRVEPAIQKLDGMINSFNWTSASPEERRDFITRAGKIKVDPEQLRKINQGEQNATEALGLLVEAAKEYYHGLELLQLNSVELSSVTTGTIALFTKLLHPGGTQEVRSQEDERKWGLQEVVGPENIKEAGLFVGNLEKHSLITKPEDITRNLRGGWEAKVKLSAYAAYMVIQGLRIRELNRELGEKRIYFNREFEQELLRCMPSRENARLLLEIDCKNRELDPNYIETQVCMLIETRWPDFQSEIIEKRKRQLQDVIPDCDQSKLKKAKKKIQEVVEKLAMGEQDWGNLMERRSGWGVLKTKIDELRIKDNRSEIRDFLNFIPGERVSIAREFDPDSNTPIIK